MSRFFLFFIQKYTLGLVLGLRLAFSVSLGSVKVFLKVFYIESLRVPPSTSEKFLSILHLAIFSSL